MKVVVQTCNGKFFVKNVAFKFNLKGFIPECSIEAFLETFDPV